MIEHNDILLIRTAAEAAQGIATEIVAPVASASPSKTTSTISFSPAVKSVKDHPPRMEEANKKPEAPPKKDVPKDKAESESKAETKEDSIAMRNISLERLKEETSDETTERSKSERRGTNPEIAELDLKSTLPARARTSLDTLSTGALSPKEKANRGLVRLPTRLDQNEGADADTGLTGYMVGFFWLTHQKDLSLLIGMPDRNVLKKVHRKFSSTGGSEDETADHIFRKIPIDQPRSVYCGHNSVGVVDRESALWIYGPKELPPLCFGAEEDSMVMEDVDRKIVECSIDLPIRTVGMGSYFSVAEAEGGQVFTFGINSNLCVTGINGEVIARQIENRDIRSGGQLGQGEFEKNDKEQGKPKKMLKVSRSKSVSCGTGHTFVVGDKKTWYWGCNEESQLGTASTKQFECRPVLFDLKQSKYQIESVSCGSHHTAVITEDGRVWVWGWNKFGQLGRSHPIVSATPLAIGDIPQRATIVACGESHTMVLTNNNHIWTWGSNRFGELGRDNASYLPATVKRVWNEDDRIVFLEGCGFSSACSTASGLLYAWGFFKGPNFLEHQPRPRLLPMPDLYVSSFGMGICHFGICCDDLLASVLELIRFSGGFPNDSQYEELAELMGRARGDVLHLVQNRALESLSMAGDHLPWIKCNVAYLVSNTQLLIVNFSQVLVSNPSSVPVRVKAHIPNLDEIPRGCKVKIVPEEFQIMPGDEVTLNVTVNVTKGVSQNVTTLMELVVTRELKKRLFFKKGRPSRNDSTKYFLVLAFPYTPMLNGSTDDTSSLLLARYCTEGNMSAIKSILARSDSENILDQRDYEGRTPLFLAAQAGHLKVVKLLVARGAGINASDSSDSTPLAAAYHRSHDAVVNYLLSLGASLDARRSGATPEELAFLRAANKLYIGARKQDLTALDEDDLLSLQAALLQKMKQYQMSTRIDSYEIERVDTPPPQAKREGTPEQMSGETQEQSYEKVQEFWRNSSVWPAVAICWHLKPSGGKWKEKLKCACNSAGMVDGGKAWAEGCFFSSRKEECALLFWKKIGDDEFKLYSIGRAKDTKSYDSFALLNMLVDDVVLGVWGNNMFNGISSVPISVPTGEWEAYYSCPQCYFPDPFLDAHKYEALLSYDSVEMAVVLGNTTVKCPFDHSINIEQIAPNLLLEQFASKRLTEEQISMDLQIGTRVGAGGFSHIYLGKIRPEGACMDDSEKKTVAVKQYIQRKPIFFSFDTPQERAAKEQELQQGAVVVYRRLSHEVQMLAVKKIVHGMKNDDEIGDGKRILELEYFSFKPPYVLTDYYVMGDLYRLLHNTYAFPDLDLIWQIGVAIDIARGLRFLSNCSPRLCHRDLKSPNIYITSIDPNAEQRAIIGDMGTVVPMFDLKRTDVVPVTNPIWMAPELIARNPYDTAVDVYR